MNHKLPKRYKRPARSIDVAWAAYLKTPIGSAAAIAILDEIQRRRGEYELPEGDDE